jgi:hypothetical protein
MFFRLFGRFSARGVQKGHTNIFKKTKKSQKSNTKKGR